tara:strand:- start:135 stop:410 length:276 start_codon:yes stop_codon:yes gene_type:complete
MSENENQDEMWRFTDDEITMIEEALNQNLSRMSRERCDCFMAGCEHEQEALKIEKLIDRILYDENDDDYLSNYNNADEIEPYGVNPLEYEK